MTRSSDYFIALHWWGDELPEASPDLSPLEDYTFELAIRSRAPAGNEQHVLEMVGCDLAEPGKCLERLKQCLGAFQGLGHRELTDENTCPDVYLWYPMEENHVMVLNEHPESSGEPARWSFKDLQEWLERKISEANVVPVVENSGSPAGVAAERKRAEGRPWFISLDLMPDEEKRFRDFGDLDSFRVMIREKDLNRLVADMANEPMNFREHCAAVLDKAQAMVREAGPEGSDFEHLYLWSYHSERVIGLDFFVPDDIYCASPVASGTRADPCGTGAYYVIEKLLARFYEEKEIRDEKYKQ